MKRAVSRIHIEMRWRCLLCVRDHYYVVLWATLRSLFLTHSYPASYASVTKWTLG